MTYVMLAQLILEVGLPLALRIAENYNRKDVVTAEELAELKVMGEQTVQSQVQMAILRSGLSLDDPKVQALLALTGTPPPPPK